MSYDGSLFPFCTNFGIKIKKKRIHFLTDISTIDVARIVILYSWRYFSYSNFSILLKISGYFQHVEIFNKTEKKKQTKYWIFQSF